MCLDVIRFYSSDLVLELLCMKSPIVNIRMHANPTIIVMYIRIDSAIVQSS